jgi:hypothetical protein
MAADGDGGDDGIVKLLTMCGGCEDWSLWRLRPLDSARRGEVAEELRKVAETFADVPDGKTASYVLGVLAHLLDPG